MLETNEPETNSLSSQTGATSNAPVTSDLQGNSVIGPQPTTTSNEITEGTKVASKSRVVFLLLLLAVVMVGVGAYWYLSNNPTLPSRIGFSAIKPTQTPLQGSELPDVTIEKFENEQAFKAFFAEAANQDSGYFGMGMSRMGGVPELAMNEAMVDTAVGMAVKTAPASPSRVSETNVQVAGIDEPDIVKTNGTELFVSQSGDFYEVRPMIEPMMMEDQVRETMIAPDYKEPSTSVLAAFPPESLASLSQIAGNGELLLHGDILMVFEGNSVEAFDVKDPAKPTSMWTYEYAENTQQTAARLMDSTLYVVAQTYINHYSPCAIPILKGSQELILPCTDVYRPNVPIAADSTYTVVKLDPATGTVVGSQSVVGSAGASVVYMSPESIYITYGYQDSMFSYLSNFFLEHAELVSADLISRIEVLKTYDISSQSKLTEIQTILDEYTLSLSNDDALKFENDLQNAMNDYGKTHQRDLEKTGIIKIANENLAVLASGIVPGSPLNQFSLDEYDNHLRIATTIDGNRFGSNESTNDVYILDDNLDQTGAVLDLGLDERIYSVRFLGDKGYLVTFRQTDPFYILDLKDPTSPQKTGELKIPGFSSYLHPLKEQVILGVGEENNQVKVSMFDVRDATNPVELSKYLLDEYWSDVQTTHHAFLQDSEHEVFFIPGSKGGYIFSYANDELTMVKAVADIMAKRAVYIDTYLYIVGTDKIVVLDERDWSEVKRFRLQNG